MANKALLVGLNAYPNPANNLRGCINDVLQMSRMLQAAFGFDDAGKIRVLTDQRATTPAIKDRLRWLLADSAAGDVLVFHYSGHGAQIRDRHGDELDDGLDEIICPYDLNWDDPFTDDDLYECLRGLNPGVNLTVVLDCCHAGTGLRDIVPAGARAARRKCLSAPPDIEHRMGSPRARAELRLRRFGRRAADAGATLLAACRSDQVSADALIDGNYHGAFTYFLGAAAQERRFKLTYAELAARTLQLLQENGYDQVPQLEGPREIGTLNLFAPFRMPATVG